MEQRKYDKATAQAIFKLSAWDGSYDVQDDGVFLNEGFRIHSPVDTLFDWTPAYDMDWPDAPDPLVAPILPIPFTASQLAACMLDGPGSSIQEAIDRRIGFALDPSDDALVRLSLRMREVRDALRDAYALAEKAQMQVGAFDYDEELTAFKLLDQAAHANDDANKREGVFADGITNEESNRRREVAVSSIANLKAQAQELQAAVNAKWFAWRKAMVHQLLRPQQVESHPKNEPVENVTAPMPTIRKEGFVLKKTGAVAKYLAIWPTIQADFNHASENGLSEAAKATNHGDWYENALLAWADQRGKRTESMQSQKAVNSVFNMTGEKHTQKG